MKNFTEQEKHLLLDLKKKYPVVLSQDKSAKSFKGKNQAWPQLVEEFNSNSNVTRRELDHIKICVANLTPNAKKDDASRRKELHRTGGGPSTSEQGLSEEALILPTIMPFMACMVYL